MSADDRTLLEMAARAAGYDFAWKGAGFNLPTVGRGPSQKFWNPLADGNDALRLARTMHMVVECMDEQTVARTFCGKHAGCVDHASAPDPDAATRRAIVLCAAAIWEACHG